MEREPIFIDQNDLLLSKHVLFPQYKIKKDDVDMSSISEELLNLFTCLKCHEFVMHPQSCQQCKGFVCNRCLGPENQCQMCNSPVKKMSKEDAKVYNLIRFNHRCSDDGPVKVFYNLKDFVQHLAKECP